MAIRNLIAMLGIVTLLVACGDKKDGGNNGGNTQANPYGQPYQYDPNAPGGQMLGDLNNPTYIPPNQTPTGIQTPIPGCPQVQAPVFHEQGSYCQWLGNQQTWNNCGFEVRRSVFERDCRAYREVHGGCFRDKPRPRVITDREIENSVERDREYYHSRRQDREGRWNDLMEDINYRREDPNYGRRPVQVARPPQPVAQPIAQRPAPVAQSPAQQPTPQQPVFEDVPTQPVVVAPAPAAPPITPEPKRPEAPAEKLDMSQCFSLEDIHNTLKNERNQISSIADVVLPASVQAKIDAAPKATDNIQQPLAYFPLDVVLKGYITAAQAPFGSFRYVGPDSRDRPRKTGWADGSALGRNVNQHKDGSVVIVNNTTVQSALIMTGRILSCRDNRYMKIRFQESADKVIQPFTAEITWNGLMNDGGILEMLMDGQYSVDRKYYPFEATRFVLWNKRSSKSNMEGLLELKKSVMHEVND